MTLRAPLSCAMAVLACLTTACEPRIVPFPEGAQPAPDFGADPVETGFELLRRGEPDLAHKAFIRGLRTTNRRVGALTGAGIASLQMGLLNRAERYFRLAAEIAPQATAVQNNLGVVLYKKGEYAEAAQAFRTAFAVSSGTSEMARLNLEISEEAVRAARPQTDPTLSHVLERRGSSEYILFESAAEDLDAEPATDAEPMAGAGAGAGPGEGEAAPGAVPAEPAAAEPAAEADADIEGETEAG